MTTYATDTYPGTGSQVEFAVTFPFIQRSHVRVYRIDNSDLSETELTVTSQTPAADEYQWQSDILIEVGTAPTTDQTLRIERDTPENQQIVQWKDGSYIVAEDLNTSDLQWLYGLQELEDKFSLLESTALKYLGVIDLTVDPAPANPEGGDFYINSGSGVVVNSWTGIAGDVVVGSEQVIYNAALSEWQILETPASQKGVLSVTGTAPIQVDATDAQRPVVSVDAATTTNAGVINEANSDNIVYGRENGAWVAVANTAVGTDPPASPQNGDGWYDLNTARLFLWVDDGNSSQWAEANPGMASGGGASVEVDDSPPVSPSEGDLWWDSSDGSGRLYVWYEDGDSDQWVEASPGQNNEVYWTDSGTALSPATAGRDVTLGAGDVSATDGTFSGNVDISGRVGIGTTSIDASLHVKGAGTHGTFVLEAGGTSGTDNQIYIQGHNNAGTSLGEIHFDETAANQGALVFKTNGGSVAERARIDSSGRLLVGTSSSSDACTFVLQGGSVGANQPGIARLQRNASLTTNTAIGGMIFGKSANDGAYIYGVADGTWTDGITQATRLVFGTCPAGSAGVQERTMITSNGTLVHGGSGSAFYLGTSSTSIGDYLIIGRDGVTPGNVIGSGNDKFLVRSDGNVTNINNSYGAISDVKLKRSIVSAASQWSDIKALQVRKYNLKEGPSHTQIGLIAQEVELVSPGLVSESPDRDAEGNDLGTVTKSVNYSVLYMKAVKALQEAMERIEALEATNASLEARLTALEGGTN